MEPSGDATRRRVLRSLGATALAAAGGCTVLDSPPLVDAPAEPSGGATVGEFDTSRSDSPMHHVDAANSGYARTEGPADAATARWTAELDYGLVRTAPVVVDGTVYVPTIYHLYALDAATGDVEWRSRRLLSATGAAVAGDAAYVGTNDVQAFDVETGDQRYRAQTDSESAHGSPCLVDGVVYCGRDDLYAIDAATGERRWRSGVEPTARAKPAYADGRLYVVTSRDPPRRDTDASPALYALDPETGAEHWRVDLADDPWAYGSPVVVDGTVYVPVREHLAAFDAESGEPRWQAGFEESVFRSPAVAEGAVFLPRLDGYVAAMDPATGEVRWETQVPHRERVRDVVVADGRVYTVNDEASVFALDAASGELRWRYDVAAAGVSGPAVSAGSLYVVGYEGTVHALEDPGA